MNQTFAAALNGCEPAKERKSSRSAGKGSISHAAVLKANDRASPGIVRKAAAEALAMMDRGEFKSQTEASRKLGISQQTISRLQMAAGAWPASSTWYGESVRAHGSCWVKHGERPASMVVTVRNSPRRSLRTTGLSSARAHYFSDWDTEVQRKEVQRKRRARWKAETRSALWRAHRPEADTDCVFHPCKLPSTAS